MLIINEIKCNIRVEIFKSLNCQNSYACFVVKSYCKIHKKSSLLHKMLNRILTHGVFINIYGNKICTTVSILINKYLDNNRLQNTTIQTNKNK